MEARWLALIVLTVARASMGFQFQSLASVAPLLTRDLAIGYAEVGFLIGVYMRLGVALYGACLLFLPWTAPAPTLVLIGLFGGLPVGVMVSLPADVLRPASRGVGMGVFYTWLYVGYALLPPIAGWLQDLSGSPAVPLYFAGGLLLSIVPLFATFRMLRGQPAMPARA